MKTHITRLIVCVLALLVANSAKAQVATQVDWYIYSTSFPNDVTLEFGTARDNFLTLAAMGGPIGTQSRVGKVTGIELRDVFDSSDLSVSTGVNLWRGTFNPSAPYTNQFGQRVYAPVIVVGKNGKVSLSRMQYRVTSSVGLLSNQSSLATLDYSVSRVGILAGPDGMLWTPDDVYVKTTSGTNLVDAIAFIGARAGALVSNSNDIDALDTEIGASGGWINFEYQFVVSATKTLKCSRTVKLYPRGQIPASYNRLVSFPGANGIQFSVVGPAGSPSMTLLTKRKIGDSWSTANAAATEGSSAFFYYTRNPTNDQGYCKLVQ